MKKSSLFLIISILLVGFLTSCGKKEDSIKRSDTIKWITASQAILIEVYNGNVRTFGGFQKNEANIGGIQYLLKETWGVTDRLTADQKLHSLVTQGHRADYIEEMEVLKQLKYFDVSRKQAENHLVSLGLSESEAHAYVAVMNAYESQGEHAIDAWDYTRALNLVGWYYIAEYYTKEEALDKALELAQELQSLYGSWDEMMESYFTGHTFWSVEDPDDPFTESFERRQIYKDLKSRKNNPYSIDWNTKLEKTW